MQPQAAFKKRKDTVATSPAVRAMVELRRTSRRPLLLSGVEPGRRITITPEMFRLVDVDRRYQRDRITTEINDLIFVLQNGGEIPDPITIVKRTYEKSDKLWIIDGQQRFMACLEMGHALQAIQHDVHSYEAERKFFLVMNQKKTLSTNVYVQSWPGESAEMLRQANRTPGHPLYNRVLFTGGGNTRIAAAVLMKGLASALTGTPRGQAIDQVLNVADGALKDNPRAKLAAAAYLSVAGRVFESGYAPVLAVVCLGLVASERWEKSIVMPNERVIERLRLVNWKTVVPSHADRFRSMMYERVAKIWRS